MGAGLNGAAQNSDLRNTDGGNGVGNIGRVGNNAPVLSPIIMRQGTGEGLGGGAGINENGRGGAGDEFDCFLADEVFPPLGLLNGQLIIIVGGNKV